MPTEDYATYPRKFPHPSFITEMPTRNRTYAPPEAPPTDVDVHPTVSDATLDPGPAASIRFAPQGSSASVTELVSRASVAGVSTGASVDTIGPTATIESRQTSMTLTAVDTSATPESVTTSATPSPVDTAATVDSTTTTADITETATSSEITETNPIDPDIFYA